MAYGLGPRPMSYGPMAYGMLLLCYAICYGCHGHGIVLCSAMLCHAGLGHALCVSAFLFCSLLLCCYAAMLCGYAALLCYALPCPAVRCYALPCYVLPFLPAKLLCCCYAMPCFALLCFAALLCCCLSITIHYSLFTSYYLLFTTLMPYAVCMHFCAMHTMPCHAMSGFAAMLSILYAMPCHATMSLWLHALWVLLCHATPWRGIALVVFNQGSGGPSAQANCIIILYLIINLAYDTRHKWHMAMSGPMAMGWGYMTAHGAHGVQCTVYGSWPKCMASLCCWWQGQWHPAQKVYWYSGIVA